MIRENKCLAVLCLILTLIATGLFFSPTYAYADNEDKIEIDNQESDSVRSFQKDYFMGLLYKKINEGKPIFDLSGKEYQVREDINEAILNGTANKKYSLFDRFGGDIGFEVYLGEEVVKTGAADKIYTAVVEAAQEGLSFANVVELITRQDSAYTNTYYQDRPALKSDGSDPRVQTYRRIGGITPIESIAVAQANYFLNTAKLIVSTVAFLAEGKVISTIADTVSLITESNTWQALTSILSIVFVLASITLVFFALKNAIGWLKRGSVAFKELICNLVGALLSLGLIAALLANPQGLIDLSKSLLTIGDNVVAQSLTDASDGNEIIASDSLDNVVEASLWEKAIFEPWVKGTFGGVTYNDLYTTYSIKGNKWQVDDATASEYGDISIPVSSNMNESVKNWAALAYSCQSKFHIDAADDSTSTEEKETGEVFPVGSKVGKSTYLYQDDFRWIDAAFKVGQYESADPNENLDSYVNTRPFNFMAGEGLHALWLSLLLIPIGILGFKKLLCAIRAMFMFVVLLARSCVNVLRPDNEQYMILGNLKACFVPILGYFFYVVLIAAGIGFYRAFGAGDNFILQVFCLCITGYMCTLSPKSVVKNFKPSHIKSGAKQIKQDIHEKAQDMSQKVQNFKAERIQDKTQKRIDEQIPLNAQQAVDNINKKIDSKRPTNPTITKDVYLNMNTDNLTAEERHIYLGLQNALNAPTQVKIYQAIEDHRKSQKNRELDKRLLHIAYDASPITDYVTNDLNEDYDREKAREYALNRSGNAAYKRVEQAKKDELKQRYDNRENLSRKELKKLRKQIKHMKWTVRANNLQDKINEKTNSNGGKIIPPIVKVMIILAILGLWLLGLVVAIIIGA